MFGGVRPEDEDRWPWQPGSFAAYAVTDDPDRVHQRAPAAGAEIVAGVRETDYGPRDSTTLDPEGNRWAFGAYRGEPRKRPVGQSGGRRRNPRRSAGSVTPRAAV